MRLLWLTYSSPNRTATMTDLLVAAGNHDIAAGWVLLWATVTATTTAVIRHHRRNWENQ